MLSHTWHLCYIKEVLVMLNIVLKLILDKKTLSYLGFYYGWYFLSCSNILAGSYLFQVNNGYTRVMCKIRSEITIKMQMMSCLCSNVLIVTFE